MTLSAFHRTVACALCFAVLPAFADDIDASRRTAITTAIEKVAPAVVTINVVEIQAQRIADPFFDDFFGFFNRPFRRPRVMGRAVEGIGTGFLMDAEGHIVTNYHVLQDADAISSVSLSDGRNLEVELVGADERADIAVLKAKGENLPFIPFGDSEDLMMGEWVIAIGNPFGNMMRDPQPSVSVGVVSANHRRVSREIGGGDRLYQNLIQTDAAINPGNSGGPLVNAVGQVIGMNTMIFSNTGGYQGLGFAIPVNRIKRVVNELIAYGHRRNPWFGFRGQAVESLDEYTLRQLGLKSASGVLVTEIMNNSPAYDAGLRPGDVVTKINNETVADPTEVDFINWDLFIGDSVELEADRQGSIVKMTFLVKELAQE